MAAALVVAGTSVGARQPAAQAPQTAKPAFGNADWTTPETPFSIVGPIHYVGTKDLAVYLITTPQGHILIDGAVPGIGPAIEKSIRTLGFKVEDVRILLTTQAHFDHVGTMAYMQKATKASVRVMQGDETLVADGGASDYLFGAQRDLHFEPTKVDVVLKDGDTVALGGVTLTALRTPGHTPGAASYTTTVTDGGKTYKVVFPASVTVNPGTRLVKNPSYAGIADDFRRTLDRLDSLAPDIYLTAHASAGDLAAKRARMKTEGAQAFVDPAGYKALHAQKRATLNELLARER